MSLIISFIIGIAQADGPAITPLGTPISTLSGLTPITILYNIFTKSISILSLIAGGFAVLYIMWYGIQYIKSNGDEKITKTAKDSIINAVIGIVIIVAAYSIISFAMTIANTIRSFVK